MATQSQWGLVLDGELGIVPQPRASSHLRSDRQPSHPHAQSASAGGTVPHPNMHRGLSLGRTHDRLHRHHGVAGTAAAKRAREGSERSATASQHPRRGNHGAAALASARVAGSPVSDLRLRAWEVEAIRLFRDICQASAGKRGRHGATGANAAFPDDALLFCLGRQPAFSTDALSTTDSPCPPGSTAVAAAPPMLLQFLLQTNMLMLPINKKSPPGDPSGGRAFGDVVAAGNIAADWFTPTPGTPPASLPPLSLLPSVAVALARAGRLTALNAPVWVQTLNSRLSSRAVGAGDPAAQGMGAVPDWAVARALAETVYALSEFTEAVGGDSQNAADADWRHTSPRCLIALLDTALALGLEADTQAEDTAVAAAQPSVCDGTVSERDAHLSLSFLLKEDRRWAWPASPTALRETDTNVQEDSDNGTTAVVAGEETDFPRTNPDSKLAGSGTAEHTTVSAATIQQRRHLLLHRVTSHATELHKLPIHTSILFDALLS